SSAAAMALIACNPCYLFLSFSFMTEVPFLAALLGSYLAFAYADCGSRRSWLWLAGAAAVVGFAIPPFAPATLIGEAIALVTARNKIIRTKPLRKIVIALPLGAALIACASLWIWLTILNPQPWMSEYYQYRLRNYLALVPLRVYLASGVLEPALYL